MALVVLLLLVSLVLFDFQRWIESRQTPTRRPEISEELFYKEQSIEKPG
jgi:hypothetical protein